MLGKKHFEETGQCFPVVHLSVGIMARSAISPSPKCTTGLQKCIAELDKWHTSTSRLGTGNMFSSLRLERNISDA